MYQKLIAAVLFLPLVLCQQKYGIRTHSGQYLRAYPGHHQRVTTQSFIAHQEQFTLVDVGSGKIAIKTVHGTYLRASPDGKVDTANNLGPWEKYEKIHQGGKVVFKTTHNTFLGAHPGTNALVKTAGVPNSWERFELVPLTMVMVQYYTLTGNRVAGHTLKLYHSGIEINGVEHYYDSSNRVISIKPKSFVSGKHFRSSPRIVHKTLAETVRIFNEVRGRWHGTRYKLFEHNCNFFVDDVLKSLGVKGVDKEYLDSGGFRPLVNRLPGSSTVADVIKILDGGPGELHKSLAEDLIKSVNPIRRVGNVARNTIRRIIG